MESSMRDTLFDKEWRKKGDILDGNWKSEVLDNISGSGGVYLTIVSNWFFDFPGTRKEKNHLKASIESYSNSDHLGAVNELSWWKYITALNYDLIPIPAGKGSTPDFLLHVNGKKTAFFEITTLNPSLNENYRKLDFSQNNSINRIIAKTTEEKIEQFKYGFNKGIPSLLVLFNYDEWTGFGTQFCRAISNSELLSEMPRELSGIIYLEKYVLEGKIYFKKDTIILKENLSAYLPVPSVIKSMVDSIAKNNSDMVNCGLPHRKMNKK